MVLAAQRLLRTFRTPPAPRLAWAFGGVVAGVLLAGWFVYASGLSAQFVQQKARPDFLSYYTGALIVARGQAGELYSMARQGQVQAEVAGVRLLPFVNPPFVALVFVPLTLLPLWVAYAAWGTVGWLLYGTALALLLSTRREASRRERVVFLGLSLSFAPWLVAQMHGQTTAVLLLAIVLVWLAFARGREGLGGLASALLLFKPQFFVLFPLLFLLRRRWRALVGAAVGAGLLLSLSWALVGWQGLVEYVGFLRRYPSLGDEMGVHPQVMPTWKGVALALMGPGTLSQVVGWALSGLTVLGLLWVWLRHRGKHGLDAFLATAVAGQLLISPHLNFHDLALLLPAGYLVWDFVRRQPSPLLAQRLWRLLLVGFAVLVSLAYFAAVVVSGQDRSNLLVTPLLGVLLLLFCLELGRTSPLDHTVG